MLIVYKLVSTTGSPLHFDVDQTDFSLVLFGGRNSLLMGTEDDSNVGRRRSSTFDEILFTEEGHLSDVDYEATGLSGMKMPNGSDDDGSVGGNQEKGYGDLSPLTTGIHSILKNRGRRVSLDSQDSNAGLSPDVVLRKLEMRNPITPSARSRRFEDGSPDVLKTASKILKEREAGHAAEKLELRSDLASLRVTIAGLNSEKDLLVLQMSQLESKIVDYESRLQDLSSEITLGTLKLQAMEKKYARTKAILTEQNNVLASEVGSKQKEKEALEKELMVLNTEKSFIEEVRTQEVEKIEALYRNKIVDLEQQIRSLDTQLGFAQDEIRAQKEIVSDARTKQEITARKNKELETVNKDLATANRRLKVTEANAVGEAERLRSEVQKQKELVAGLQWMIANPNRDPSGFSATNVDLAVPVSTKVGARLTFGATPEKVSSKANGSVPFVEQIRVEDDSKEEIVVDAAKSTGSVDMSTSLPMQILQEDVFITSSSNLRRDSLESVRSTGGMTLEQKRAAKAEEEKLLKEQKKAERSRRKLQELEKNS